MKIFYSEKRTINLGNYNSKSVEIGIEDNIDCNIETPEGALERLRAFVLVNLDNSLNEKHKITKVTKINNEEKTEVQTPEVKKEERQVLFEQLSAENVRPICVALKEFDKKLGREISDKLLYEMNGKLETISQSQLLELVTFITELMNKNHLEYDKTNNEIIVRI